MGLFAAALLAGFLGTLLMDSLNCLGSRLGLLKRIDIATIGRMAAGWMRGRFRYRHPGELEAVTGEKRYGYLTHYGIGVGLALPYAFGWSFLAEGAPSAAWAVAYGVLTTAASYFFVFPCLGMGVAGRRSPDGVKGPLSSLANHFFYGLGLAAGIALI